MAAKPKAALEAEATEATVVLVAVVEVAWDLAASAVVEAIIRSEVLVAV